MKKAFIFWSTVILIAINAYLVSALCCGGQCYDTGFCFNDVWYPCACNTSKGAVPPGNVLGACLQCIVNSTGNCNWIANYSLHETGYAPCINDFDGHLNYYYCNVSFEGSYPNSSQCVSRDIEKLYCESGSCKQTYWVPTGMSDELLLEEGRYDWRNFSYVEFNETSCCGDDWLEYPIRTEDNSFICCDSPDSSIDPITKKCLNSTANITRCEVDDLIAYYKMDESNGYILHDHSSNGLNGTIEKPWWASGKLDGGLRFDGTSYVNFGNSVLFQPKDLSFLAWIKRTEDWNINWGTNMLFYAKKLNVEGQYYQYTNGWYIESYYLNVPGDQHFEAINFYVDGHNYFSIDKTPNDLFPLNEWVHIAATFNSTTKEGKVFVNGVSQQLVKIGNPTSITSDINANETMARWQSNYQLYGVMDEVSIWDTDLSWDKIQEIYNEGIGLDLCEPPRCGDGITQLSMGEQCDDKNTVNNDLCNNSCSLNNLGNALIVDFNGKSNVSEINWIHANKENYNDILGKGWVARDIDADISEHEPSDINNKKGLDKLIYDYQEFNSTYKVRLYDPHSYNLTYIVGGEKTTGRFTVKSKDSTGVKSTVTIGPVKRDTLKYITVPNVVLSGIVEFNFTKENNNDFDIINGIIIQCNDCGASRDSFIRNEEDEEKIVHLVMGVEKKTGSGWEQVAIVYNSSTIGPVSFPEKGEDKSYRHLYDFWNLGTGFSTYETGYYRIFAIITDVDGEPIEVMDDIYRQQGSIAYSETFEVS